MTQLGVLAFNIFDFSCNCCYIACGVTSHLLTMYYWCHNRLVNTLIHLSHLFTNTCCFSLWSLCIALGLSSYSFINVLKVHSFFWIHMFLWPWLVEIDLHVMCLSSVKVKVMHTWKHDRCSLAVYLISSCKFFPSYLKSCWNY